MYEIFGLCHEGLMFFFDGVLVSCFWALPFSAIVLSVFPCIWYVGIVVYSTLINNNYTALLSLYLVC